MEKLKKFIRDITYSYDMESSEDVNKLYYLIKAFDKLCDAIREELIYILNNARIEEHEETYTKTIKSVVID